MSQANQPSANDGSILPRIREDLSPQAFEDWHALQEQERNRQEGYDDTRNDPSYTPPANKHSPSSLLKCHRMQYYQANNAPREDQLPYGIFKFGHDFEAYIQEFLSDWVVPSIATIQNPVQIGFEEDGLRFDGSTDPIAFVTNDPQPTPIAMLEVKTTKNIYYVKENGPKNVHRAQMHAYAKGLKDRFNLPELPTMFVIYGSRETLDITVFEVEFDEEFWENEVLKWANKDTEYRETDTLPPSLDFDGDKGFQCGYCDFAERCGNYDPDSEPPEETDYGDYVDDYWWDDSINREFQDVHSDLSPVGFLPAKRYPENTVISHLQTYPDVKLTPTLAMQHPDLVMNGHDPGKRLQRLYDDIPQRKVYDWHCPECSTTYGFGTFAWDGDIEDLPTCPDCSDTFLRGPRPGELDL